MSIDIDKDPQETGEMLEATVITTNDAVTTIATIAIPDDTRVTVKAHFVCRRTDASTNNGGHFERWVGVFRDSGGGVEQDGTIYTPFTRETPVSLNATISVSGNNVLLEVKGIAGATYEWKVFYQLLSI